MSVTTFTGSTHAFAGARGSGRALRQRLASAREAILTIALFGTLAAAVVAVKAYVWMPPFIH